MKPVVMLTDANVFLRFLRNDHPQHSPAAKKLIEEAAASRVILQVPEIVVADIFYTLTAPMMKIPRADRFLSVWRECRWSFCLGEALRLLRAPQSNAA